MPALAQLKPFILQGAFLASLYSGAKMIRKWSEVQPHPEVLQYVHVKAHGGISSVFSQMAEVGTGPEFRALLEKCEELMRLSRTSRPDAQCHISRLSSEISQGAKRFLSKPCGDAQFRACQYCLEECLPMLETHMDDVLHNHLLDRSFG